MSTHQPSPRREELLESAYAYVLEHGLTELSLRPLAGAIGSSPRVLLYLFDSKDGLVHALLARARRDERRLLDELDAVSPASLETVARGVWEWLTAPEHRSLLVLWAESYARSLTDPDGAWSGFARATVDDWLALLARAQPRQVRDTVAGAAQRTVVLAILRGALLDLLATGEEPRTTAAVRLALRTRTAPATGMAVRSGVFVSMSPTVFRDGPFRFFFFSREEQRLHIHVQSSEGEAKFWIDPEIELARNYQLSAQDLSRALQLVADHEQEIRDAWHHHFGR